MSDHDHDHGPGPGHEHRMEQDGRGFRAAWAYGRHIKDFWQSDVNRAVVERIAPARGETVLDVGAGMGAAVFAAAARVGSGLVIAVEPTPFMRRMLRIRRAASRHRGRILVVDGLAEDLGQPAASVDGAWSVNTMHHVSDLEAMCAELYRVLRPGGRLLLLDEDFDDPAHRFHDKWHGHHDHNGDDDGDEGHDHAMVDFAELAVHLEQAGFADVEAGPVAFAGVPTRLSTARR